MPGCRSPRNGAGPLGKGHCAMFRRDPEPSRTVWKQAGDVKKIEKLREELSEISTRVRNNEMN